MIRKIISIALVSTAGSPASAAPTAIKKVAAVLNLASAPLVKPEREGSPVKLTSYKIPLSFKAMRPEVDITRQLIDPKYRPKKPSPVADDFSIQFFVRAVGGKSLSALGLCLWNAQKTNAECSIEDDGGQFTLRIVKRGTVLKSSKFQIRVYNSGEVSIGRSNTEPDASIYLRNTSSSLNSDIAIYF